MPYETLETEALTKCESLLLPKTTAGTYPIAMISGKQIRAGRALLGWKQRELAAAAGLSEVSIKNAERGCGFARLDPERHSARLRQSRCDLSGHRRHPQWWAGGAVERMSHHRIAAARGSRSRIKPSLFCQLMRSSSEHNVGQPRWDRAQSGGRSPSAKL